MSSASGRPPVIPPPAPRNDRSTAIWWILGIVAGGIVVMVLLALVFAGVVLRNSHINEQGKNLDIQTPVGELKVDQSKTHSSGLPVYPGAKEADSDDHATVELTHGDEGLGIGAEKYVTTDSLDKVTAWYAQHLGPGFRRGNPKSNEKIHGVDVENDSDVEFVDDRGDGARVVGLKKQDATVEISLLRIGKREAQ